MLRVMNSCLLTLCLQDIEPFDKLYTTVDLLPMYNFDNLIAVDVPPEGLSKSKQQQVCYTECNGRFLQN
jgi:hypothetical protein